VPYPDVVAVDLDGLPKEAVVSTRAGDQLKLRFHPPGIGLLGHAMILTSDTPVTGMALGISKAKAQGEFAAAVADFLEAIVAVR
jgi:hypothetical protein